MSNKTMNMKRIWLSGIAIVMSLSMFAQKTTPIGTAGRVVDVLGSSMRLEYLKATHSATKFLQINSTGDIVLVTPTFTVPIASSGTVGGIRVGSGLSIDAGTGILSVIPGGSSEPVITPGTTSQYWRGDKTFQSLVMSALGNWPTPVGQAGKFLTNDGTNYSWATTSGGSGLSDAYSSFTDGVHTSTATGSTTFKFRSANALLTFLVTANDITHGDNLLATINQGSFVLTESQITNLASDLAGKEPSLSAGTTSQYYRGDKSWQTLNTSVVPEGSNLYYTNARVQTFADTRYSLTTHNHSFDGLTNVNMTGKAVGSIPQWNGSFWVPIPTPTSGGTPTINLTGDVTGTYSSPNIPTTIAANAVSNSKLATMVNNTIKGNVSGITASPTDLTATQVKTMLALGSVDNTNDISKPISTAVQTALNLKADLASPHFTGDPQVPTPLLTDNDLTIVNSSWVTSKIAASTAGVSQFNGRTGAVTPLVGDYSAFYPLQTGSGASGTWGISITGNAATATNGVVTTGSYSNPTWVTALDFAKLLNVPTTSVGYGITDVYTKTAADGRYAPISHTHAASDITSGVIGTVRLGSGTANSGVFLRGDQSWSAITESNVTNLSTDLTAKANLAGGATFTGPFVAPRTGNVVLQTDTLSLLTFGGGEGLSTDTSGFQLTAIYGSPYIGGTDSLIVTSVIFVLQGSSPSITIDILYGPTLNSGGTHLVNAGTVVTNTTTGTIVTSFNNTKIPPGNFVWCKTPAITTKPTEMSVTVMGYKSRKG